MDKNATNIFHTVSKMKVMRIGHFFNSVKRCGINVSDILLLLEKEIERPGNGRFFSDDVYIDQTEDNGIQGFCVDAKNCNFAIFSAYLSFTLQFNEFRSRAVKNEFDRNIKKDIISDLVPADIVIHFSDNFFSCNCNSPPAAILNAGIYIRNSHTDGTVIITVVTIAEEPDISRRTYDRQ